jgi:uncharacterized protein YoxC
VFTKHVVGLISNRGDTKKTRREMADELDYMEKQLMLLTAEIKDKIKSIVEDIERKVGIKLT